MAELLIVDDDPAIRRMLERTLAAEGYELRVAVDGGAALAALEGSLPDLLVARLHCGICCSVSFAGGSAYSGTRSRCWYHCSRRSFLPESTGCSGVMFRWERRCLSPGPFSTLSPLGR